MLTQVCRDPGSPFHGCWDRNWWHYKVRDFPSIILQQGGYSLHLASQLSLGETLGSVGLKSLAAASARFWNMRALRHGAFEEYYPFEQGYPPLAFSTLSVAKLALEGVVPLEDVRPGLAVAAKQLLSRFEARAANQQVAGTAAAAAIFKLVPSLIPKRTFSALLERTLALQEEEGWFPEYDGPDLGYLTVTMDCLWDIYDFTGDERCRHAISRACHYIAWFVLGPLGAAGMHNSRNTDYLVPYAIARLAAEPSPDQEMAKALFVRLFRPTHPHDHFFNSIDDRYWCHYIGHSLLRALQVIKPADLTGQIAPPLSVAADRMPGSGHMILKSESVRTLISSRKGCILTIAGEDGNTASDYGWIVRRGGMEYVSHWWSRAWETRLMDNAASCIGPMVGHKEQASAPWKHGLLRIASFVAGRRLIEILKEILIFKKNESPLRFERKVHANEGTVMIEDRITGILDTDEIVRAPRASKRHVASADSFHPEDLTLANKFNRFEELRRQNHSFECVTKFQMSSSKS